MKKMEDDLFLEMMEVYMNSILYIREIYPAAIFRRRRVYNTATYISIFPALNSYLLNALKTAQELKANNRLFQVELIIYRHESKIFATIDDEDILERYIFRVEHNENDGSPKNDVELYILKFEEELRRGLFELESTAKNLTPLNSEMCSFRIQLETTEKSFIEIVTKDNSKADVRTQYSDEVSIFDIKLNILFEFPEFSMDCDKGKRRFHERPKILGNASGSTSRSIQSTHSHRKKIIVIRGVTTKKQFLIIIFKNCDKQNFLTKKKHIFYHKPRSNK